MAILTSKPFTRDHLSHVLISIFIVFLLRIDRILCVCVCVFVCVCVQCTNTFNSTSKFIYEYISYDDTIMSFLHVASP